MYCDCSRAAASIRTDCERTWSPQSGATQEAPPKKIPPFTKMSATGTAAEIYTWPFPILTWA